MSRYFVLFVGSCAVRSCSCLSVCMISTLMTNFDQFFIFFCHVLCFSFVLYIYYILFGGSLNLLVSRDRFVFNWLGLQPHWSPLGGIHFGVSFQGYLASLESLFWSCHVIRVPGITGVLGGVLILRSFWQGYLASPESLYLCRRVYKGIQLLWSPLEGIHFGVFFRGIWPNWSPFFACAGCLTRVSGITGVLQEVSTLESLRVSSFSGVLFA